jgi:hypothetical protein
LFQIVSVQNLNNLKIIQILLLLFHFFLFLLLEKIHCQRVHFPPAGTCGILGHGSLPFNTLRSKT